MITLVEFRDTVVQLATVLPKYAPDFKNKDVIKGYYGALQDLDPTKLADACDLASKTLDEFPSIRKLLELSEGNILDEEEIAQDIASKIENAIRLYGWPSPGRAREYIGELGWEVVNQSNGWNEICDLNYDALPSARKRWRELAVNLYKNHRAFGEDKRLAIPSKIPEKSIALQRALNLIDGGKS